MKQPFVVQPRPIGRPGDYPMVIGSTRAGTSDDAWMEVPDPYTGKVWARVPDASASQVDEAVSTALDAFEHGPWAGSTALYRGRLLRRLGEAVAAAAPELTQLQVMENGKAIREQYAQTLGLADHLNYFAGVAEQLHGRTIPVSIPGMLNYTVHEPIGVVACLSAWNSPLNLLMWKLAPALAAGNTVVVKPSDVTPVSALRLGALCLEAGFPPGVVNVITGGASAGASLVAHHKIGMVAFTGSTAVGRKVAVAAGERLARYSLELGGKSPNIVFDDADLDAAVSGVVGGIFAAAGQTCIAGSRVLVQRGARAEVLDRLAEQVEEISFGDPLDWGTEVGTIATPTQLRKIEEYVATAQGEGARLIAGGERHSDGTSTQFYRPTVFADVDNRMRIAREEVFGPIAAVIEFEDEDDAVRIANDSPFGLAAGVWTRDIGRAHRIVPRLRCGTVWVNTYRRTHYSSPFGGYGESGVGRENGAESVHEYTETKSVWIDAEGRMSDPFNPFA